MSIFFQYMEDFEEEDLTRWEEENPRTKKTCLYCERLLPKTMFPKHIHNKDNLDSRCHDCIKEQTELRSNLRAIAPRKPDSCECCGKETNSLNLDHDHDTLEIRGWICSACNTGIGKLQDNIEGVKKALTYLEKCKKEYNRRNIYMIKDNKS